MTTMNGAIETTKAFIVQCNRPHPAYLHILACICDPDHRTHGIFVPSFDTQNRTPIMTLTGTLWRTTRKSTSPPVSYDSLKANLVVDATMNSEPVRALNAPIMRVGRSFLAVEHAREEWNEMVENLSDLGRPFLVIKGVEILQHGSIQLLHIQYGAIMRFWRDRACAGHWDEVAVCARDSSHDHETHRMWKAV